LLLAAVTGVGACLRLVGLDRESLWNDELGSWTQYTQPTIWRAIAHTSPQHVPGYWMLMHVWTRVAGDSEAMLRLPSALLGVATIPAMFALGRRLYGEREGLIAAGLVAVAWAPVHYSQEARPYALLLLAVVLSSAWLTDVVRARRAGAPPPRWAELGYVGAAVAAAYAHYFGAAIVVLHAVAGAFAVRRRRGALRAMAPLWAVLLLAYVPLVRRALRTVPSGLTRTIAPGVGDVWDVFRFFFNESSGIAALVLAAWALALGRGLRRRERASAETWLLVTWLVLPVAGAFAWSAAVRWIFVDHALQIVLPAAYLLLARALTRLPLRSITAPALLALLLAHLIAVQRFYTMPHKEQFREAAGYVVAEDDRETPALVVACAWNPGYFDYYLARQGSARRVARLVEVAGDASAVAALVGESRARDVWLLAGHKQPEPALLAALAVQMTLVDERHLLGASVWHYRVR
jgi:uncharacterized membrane protein